MDNLSVIVPAAGSGKRMGSNLNKQYMLLNSRPVLTYCLDIFEKSDFISEVIIVAHPEEVNYCKTKIVKEYNFTKVSQVIDGGAERQESVWKGLKCLGKDSTYVAVHDGARPLVTDTLLQELYAKVKQCGAVVPGVPVKDTIKTVDSNNTITSTPDRSSMVAVQTPQIFNYEILFHAYEKASELGIRGTDDASLVEAFGTSVEVIPGDYRNIKITTAEDLLIARYFLMELKQGGEKAFCV